MKKNKLNWYHVWVQVGPGHMSHHETYFQATKDEIEDEAKDWAADNWSWTDYVVYWKKVTIPPQKWIEEEIKKKTAKIKYWNIDIKEAVECIELLNKLLKKGK